MGNHEDIQAQGISENLALRDSEREFVGEPVNFLQAVFALHDSERERERAKADVIRGLRELGYK